MQKLFTASQFTSTQWDTAQDKADFANRFAAFLQQNCSMQLFTQKFYQRLSNCFHHIAHYDRAGFYSTWFETPQQRAAFVTNTLESAIYGDPAWTYSDVERSLQDWLRSTGIPAAFAEAAQDNTKAKELDLLRRLGAKYPDEVAAMQKPTT